MSIVAQCTNCGKKYKVAETSVGKQVRCQACQTTFTVQAAVAVAAGANAAGSKPTARTGQSARPASSSNNAQQMQLAQRFGLAPLPPNENTVFSETPYQRPANQHDPLANHLVYDPGFAPVSVADYHATQVPKEQSMHDYMKQIEDEERQDKRTESGPKWTWDQKQLFAAVFAPFACIAFAAYYYRVYEGDKDRAINALFRTLFLNFVYFQAHLCYAASKCCKPNETLLFIFFPPYRILIYQQKWKYLKGAFIADSTFQGIVIVLFLLSLIGMFVKSLMGE